MKTLRIMTLLTVVLFTNIAHAQTNELDKVKADIADLLKKMIMIWELKPGANEYSYWANTKGTLVLEDKIEFRHANLETIIVYFSDIIDYQITINFDALNKIDRVYLGNLSIVIPGKGNGKQFFDDLIFIQNQLIEKRNSQLVLFVPIAEKYRALKAKPPISEELRKYIVQANGFNEQKGYDKAIEKYKKAIEVDQTAYPAAYSNLALLSAQKYQFNAAIYYMKKYLMLEPEADDARSAQDKIYFWEAQLGK
jgi:tetratricopeptide (TPR) repeat protein